MTSTFFVSCDCCGQAVEARDAGFDATTVEVAACDRRKAVGTLYVTVRKSAAYAAEISQPAGWQHRDGLVTFG